MTERFGAIPAIAMPPRKARIETYLYDTGDETSLTIANSLYKSTQPLAEFGAIIPVAAHQEAGWIEHTLGQYAGQEGAEPFSVVLYFNSPLYGADTEVDRAYDALEGGQDRFKSLDIRFAALDFDETPPIGRVRKDIWDAVGRLALADGIYDQPGREFIGLNHDIDKVWMHPHHIRNVQRHYRALQAQLNRTGRGELPLPSRYTESRHRLPFDTHPNLARGLLWHEISLKQKYRGGGYTEGMVIPFSWLAHHKGFDPAATIHETHRMDPPGRAGIPLTPMVTSERRMLARLATHGFRGIWDKDTFRTDEAYRDPNKEWPDISKARLEEIVFDSLLGDIQNFLASIPTGKWNKVWDRCKKQTQGESLDYALLTEEVEELIAPRLDLAAKILDRTIDSPLLNSFLEGEYRKGIVMEQAFALCLNNT